VEALSALTDFAGNFRNEAGMTTTNDEIFEKIRNILSDVLDVDADQFTLATSANDIEEWDSLSHIRLMVTIEKAFKIKFTNSEIESLNNVGELVSLVGRKLS
jgi:acyl carrier protein